MDVLPKDAKVLLFLPLGVHRFHSGQKLRQKYFENLVLA